MFALADEPCELAHPDCVRRLGCRRHGGTPRRRDGGFALRLRPRPSGRTWPRGRRRGRYGDRHRRCRQSHAISPARRAPHPPSRQDGAARGGVRVVVRHGLVRARDPGPVHGPVARLGGRDGMARPVHGARLGRARGPRRSSRDRRRCGRPSRAVRLPALVGDGRPELGRRAIRDRHQDDRCERRGHEVRRVTHRGAIRRGHHRRLRRDPRARSWHARADGVQPHQRRNDSR